VSCIVSNRKSARLHSPGSLVIAFIFPGQGSQQVGMGKALADRFPVARHTFEEADEAFAAANVEAGLPWPERSRGQTRLQTRRLSTICWEGPESDLQLTE